MSGHLRKPAVAGQFYPGTERGLRKELQRLIPAEPLQRIPGARACILPHAGYMYSGAVAARTLSSVVVPGTVVLLGPNHTGYGMPLSILCEGEWETPLGRVPVNAEFAHALLKNAPYLQQDPSAHAYEHSLEVQVPFLQQLRPDVKIVPIVVAEDVLAALQKLGRDIADTIIARNERESILIAASSDMTHYEPQDQARQKDNEAIDAIVRLDESLLLERVRAMRITMCGYAPAACAVAAAKALGASAAKLIDYRTSGDVTGDCSSVVGYAGIVLY